MKSFLISLVLTVGICSLNTSKTMATVFPQVVRQRTVVRSFARPLFVRPRVVVSRNVVVNRQFVTPRVFVPQRVFVNQFVPQSVFVPQFVPQSTIFFQGVQAPFCGRF